MSDGRAHLKYTELIVSQGGRIDAIGSPVYSEYPFDAMHVTSPDDGYVRSVKADLIGKASVLLGAGRLAKTDPIDYGAGLCFYAKRGDKVRRGDVLCSLCHGEHANLDEERLYDAMDLVLEAYEIGPEPPESRNAVIDVLS